VLVNVQVDVPPYVSSYVPDYVSPYVSSYVRMQILVPARLRYLSRSSGWLSDRLRHV